MGWVYYTSDGEVAHIFPKRDSDSHETGNGTCWCCPQVSLDNAGREIVVHQSRDGKQDLEAGIRAIPRNFGGQHVQDHR